MLQFLTSVYKSGLRAFADWREGFKGLCFKLAVKEDCSNGGRAVNRALASCDAYAPSSCVLNLSYNSSALPTPARLNRWNQINWLLLD